MKPHPGSSTCFWHRESCFSLHNVFITCTINGVTRWHGMVKQKPPDRWKKHITCCMPWLCHAIFFQGSIRNHKWVLCYLTHEKNKCHFVMKSKNCLPTTNIFQDLVLEILRWYTHIQTYCIRICIQHNCTKCKIHEKICKNNIMLSVSTNYSIQYYETGKAYKAVPSVNTAWLNKQ